jgi:DNA helicase-2/ATP-dependent DNA helicase PcrA
MSLLAFLNDQQREAVTNTKGPLLVLAGAGSGKTRVITYRIAYLMQEQGIPPGNILAVTFTNKAAAEMRERVAELTEDQDQMPLVATFHSFCLRLLRRHIHLIDYPNSFSIYDTDDQTALIRRICKELGYDEMTPRAIQSKISAAKNSKYGPLKALENQYDANLEDIYHRYQKGLKQAGAADFDDLLLLTNDLFNARPELLHQYQQQFQQVLVDEFQDTNAPQFNLVRTLAAPQNNICVVGDDDQSIYRWRGADVQNILNFSQDFEGTRVVKLEQNYRSTQNILDAAHGVVKNMLGRHPKKLWTDKGEGKKVSLFQGDDESSEASFVIRNINSLRKTNSLNDCAVLFRTNSQSRAFEEALNRHKLPYQLVGGTKFYDRKEIKDILAYIQVVLNPADVVSMRRIINTPARGIGDVSVARIATAAEKFETTMWEIIENRMQFTELTPAQRNSVSKFRDLVISIRQEVEKKLAASDVIEYVVRESGYFDHLHQEGTDEALGRIDNIRELVTSAKSFEANTTGEVTIDAFVDQVSLISDVDTYDSSASGKVTLMTLHAAKGLEFPFVFLAGLEEGLLPHQRNLEEPDLLEEERRLCYVGITRAQEKLYLTAARSRRTYEGYKISRPSRFLDDIPVTVMEERGGERLLKKRRVASVGNNIDNISQFFKDRQINIDTSRLNKHASSLNSGDFNKGDKVFLPKYGDGTVMGIQGTGDSKKYIVYFPKIGQRKKIMARLGTLKRR